MKKKSIFLLSLLLGFAVATTVACSSDDELNIPPAVTATFELMYPGVTPEWEIEQNLWKAEFRKDGKEMDAWFQTDGVWVMTETDIAMTELPAAVVAAVNANYPDYAIDDADWVETPLQDYYEVELDKKGQPDVHLKITEEGVIL